MERNIYKYNDGTRDVFADPSVLDYRIIKAFDKENMKVIENQLELPRKEDGEIDWDGMSEDAMRLFADACCRLDPLVREAFEIAPFNKEDGTGLLQVEVIKIYMDYIAWKDSLKKSTD